MSAVVWANILLAVPFLIAFIAVPLWLTFRWSQRGPDHAEARAYLRSRAGFARAAAARKDAARTSATPRRAAA
jgi:hypothetical protein